MTRGWPLVVLSVLIAVACSTRDQTLGETRPSPDPMRPDIDPDPPEPDPPEPDPPEPDPGPGPEPMVPPCEDETRHANTGTCRPIEEGCPSGVITRAGYECAEGLHCCEEPLVGCGLGQCGGADSGPALPPGGAGAGSP